MSRVVAQREIPLAKNTEGVCLPWCFCFLRAWFLVGAVMNSLAILPLSHYRP